MSGRGYNAFASVAISPDAALLACGGFGQFRVLNARTGAKVAVGYYSEIWSVTQAINAMAFSPDSKLLALTWPEDKGLRIYVARTGMLRRAIKDGHRGHVSTLCFAPDGKRLASGGEDGFVRVWYAGTGKLAVALRTGAPRVAQLFYAPDGKRLFVACPHRGKGLLDAGASLELQSWDTASWKRQWSSKMPAGPFGVASLAVRGDGKLIAVACGPTVRVMKTRTQAPVASFKGPATITGLAFGPVEGLLAGSAGDGSVTLWNLASRRPVERLDASGRDTGAMDGPHTKWVYGVAANLRCRLLCAVDRDGTVTTWRLQAPACPTPAVKRGGYTR